MSVLTIRLSEKLLKDADRIAKNKKLSRSSFIRETLEESIRKTLEAEKRKRLREASLKVRRESMKVNAEFAKFEEDAGD